MKNRLLSFLPVILDLVVPTLGYLVLHAAGLGDVWALTIAGSLTGLIAIANSVRRRKVDLLGVLVVAELAASAALAVWTHDARLILARSALYVAIAGVVLLGSALAGRPMTYPAASPMATKGDPVRAKAYAAAWVNSAQLRRIHTWLSAFIGIVLLIFAATRIVIIYTTSVAEAVWAQEVPGIVMLVLVFLAIRIQVPKLQKIVDAEQHRLPADEPAVVPVTV
jgi:intracellular septation protein A